MTAVAPPEAPAPLSDPRRPSVLAVLAPGRLIPAASALGAVAAAGVAFGRVFGFGAITAPLVLSLVVGAIGGLGARLLLASGTPVAVAERRPDPDATLEPGPAWLVDEPVIRPAALLTSRTLNRLLALVAAAVTTVVSAVLVDAVAATPTGGGQGVSGLVSGWSRILTTSVPVPPTPDRLPVLAGVIALGAVAAVVAGSRTHPGVDALLPAGAVLLVALALGVDGPGSVVAVSAAPAVLAGVYLLVVSRPTDVGVAWIPPARSAAALATGAVVVIIALVVGSNWPLATARTPVNLRSHLSPPVALGQAANPLDLVPRLEGETSTVAFTAQVDATWISNPTDWRLVSLDVYDGTGWTTDARAVRAGNVLQLPAGEDAGHLGPSSSQTVTVKNLDGPWVPTTGVPTRVTPSDLAYDPSNSVLVGAGDLDGRTFHLTSRIPSPTRAELDSAGLTVSDANTLLTQVPGCAPPELAQMAQKATSGLGRPDQEAVAIEQTLATRSGFADDPAATPGSSCGRLQQFVTAKQGTDEQFATAFVLMARSVGLPARLAVGFSPGAINATAGTTTVMGSDATVWPEVDFAHVGWVAFDPIPSNTTAGAGGSAPSTTTTTTPAQKGISQVRNTVANSPSSTSPTGQHGTTPTVAPAHKGSAWSPWYLIPIGVVVLAAAFVLLQIGRRRRRRARRRDPARPPAERISGAWAEVLDALAPFEPAVASLTPSEVAGAAAAAAPGAAEPVQGLGVLVDAATYGSVGSPEDATAAWALSDRAVHALRGAIPLGLRLRHLVTGGPRRERVTPPPPPLAPPGGGAGSGGDVPPVVERPSVPV